MYSVITTAITATANCPQLDFELLGGRPTPPNLATCRQTRKGAPLRAHSCLPGTSGQFLGSSRDFCGRGFKSPRVQTPAVHTVRSLCRSPVGQPAWWRVGCPHCRPKDMTAPSPQARLPGHHPSPAGLGGSERTGFCLLGKQPWPGALLTGRHSHRSGS